jgi:UDP-glucose 4-epimerase
MRCLVTGASGHLGSYLTERLVSQGAEVIVLVRPQSNLWRLTGLLDRIQVIRADLSDLAHAAPAIALAKPEAVFHLAWQGVTSTFKNDPEQITCNVEGSLDLFRIIESAGCRLWIGLGSQAEYGPNDKILSEDTPLRPTTAYGVAKLSVGLLTEKLCELAEMRHIWLRLLATYGPKDDERHLLPSVILQLLSGNRPRLTAGEQRWDYLYIEDAAEAIYQAALSEKAHGFFNLGSGEAHSVRSILEKARDLIDASIDLGFGELSYPTDQQMRLETSIDRLSRATGWKPQINLEAGLSRTVEWYRAKDSTAAQHR